MKYVHESMEDFLSPAFYLTPPIDTQTPNTIYINRASTTSNLELFTTLAHEGFPGHLYQTVYFSRENVDPVRHLFTCGGYIEGWATYVESYAYGYADADPALTRLLWLNRSINLNLYCLLDIGIHYHGWDLSQVTRYLRLFGITDQEAAGNLSVYHRDPANYLRYYVGYLGFCDLKNAAEKEEGNSFQLKEFTEKFLRLVRHPFPFCRNICCPAGLIPAGFLFLILPASSRHTCMGRTFAVHALSILFLVLAKKFPQFVQRAGQNLNLLFVQIFCNRPDHIIMKFFVMIKSFFPFSDRESRTTLRSSSLRTRFTYPFSPDY